MSSDEVHRCWWQWQNNYTGKPITSGFYLGTSGSTVWDHNFVFDAMEQWWDSGHSSEIAGKSRSPSGIILQRVRARRVKPAEDVIQERIITPAVAGTATGDSDSPNTSPLLSYRSEFIGRSRRGRGYFPQTTEAFLDVNGFITSANVVAYLNSVVAMFHALKTGLNQHDHVVYSPKLDDDADVVSYLGDQIPRTQRRRSRSAAYSPSTFAP
jgi:hypothetical protein